jgi:hypothetical protein
MGTERRKIRGDPWITFACHLLRDVPKLDGAICAGNSATWDGDTKSGPKTLHAAQLCLYRCPCFAECQAWVDGICYDNRPPGVVAGRFRSNAIRNRRKKPQ